MAKKTLLLCLVLLYSTNSQCQIFTDVTDSVGGFPLAPSRLFGAGISFYDVNEDGWDDLTLPVKNDTLKVWLSDGESFSIIPLFFIQGEMKMALWGDYDNDGDNDVYIPVFQGASKLFRNNGDWNFEDVTVEAGLSSFSFSWFFGASWCDYNNDGWLDIIQTSFYNYNSLYRNYLFKGSANGVFTDESLSSGIHLGSAFSFQSSACDLDFDGDQDIHIANDKGPIDALLINEGPWFSNQASTLGLDLASNSMSSSITDYDHDGEYEIFITNTPEFGNYILDNLGGVVYDTIVHSATLVSSTAWAALWLDYDNDTWEDLFIANESTDSMNVPFFFNVNGVLNGPNGSTGLMGFNAYSASKGDFNGDGFYDMVVSSGEGLEPRLYRNNYSGNNFIRIKLEGTDSNRSGIGAYIQYWINGQRFILNTASGNSYLSQDSQWLNIGLGDFMIVDSLQINWLAGTTTNYYGIAANQSILIVENPNLELNVIHDALQLTSDTIMLCAGQQIVLESENGMDVLWSNTQYQSQILVDSAGVYSYMYTDQLNQIYHSNSIHVVLMEQPEVTWNLEPPSCFNSFDGILELEVGDQWSFLLSDSSYADNLSLDSMTAGEYWFYLLSEAGCSMPWSLQVEAPQPLEVEVNVFSSQAEFDVTGGMAPYQFFINDSLWLNLADVPLDSGWNHWLLIDANGCNFQDSIYMEPEVVLNYLQSLPNEDFIFVNLGKSQWYFEQQTNSVIEVFDLTGKSIFHSNSISGFIDMSTCSNGVYFLTVKTPKHQQVRKFFELH